ncbi:hypothetical protein JST99_01540 [Candidatus Dependentiae bacterium]|nr:hypothetical protein [Candidatus Dependentiae bacterium]MCC7415204.1 hypothetical protein [Campylobacterota bacterium]
MKLKNFKDLVEECLTKQEIAEIEQQAQLELQAMQSLQSCLKKAMDDYMKKNKVGFNELVRRLNSNPRQVAKIQQGKANLTLASIAHIAALLGQEPTIVFKKK